MIFGRPILCLVLDRSCCSLPIADAVEAAVRAGVDWVQIRERELDSSVLLALARDIKSAVERGSPGRNVRMIVNRRIDIALALGSSGVHLGFDALPVAQAREPVSYTHLTLPTIYSV